MEGSERVRVPLKSIIRFGSPHNQVAMITIAPSSALLEPKKESDRDSQTGEQNEAVEPAQAPLYSRSEDNPPITNFRRSILA